MSGYDDMARHVRDALEESEVQADGSCIIRPEHYLQLNADFEAWDEADDAKRDAAPVIAEAGERERARQLWAKHLRTAPQGNGVAQTMLDNPSAQDERAIAAITEALSTPATLDNTAVAKVRAIATAAYTAGAQEVHAYWKQCRPDVTFESEPDFTEAAGDYGRCVAEDFTAKTEKA